MKTHLRVLQSVSVFRKPYIIDIKRVFWEQIEDKVNPKCFILKGLQISAARKLKQQAYPSYVLFVWIGGRH